MRACAEQAYALYVPRMGKKPAPMVADFRAQIAAGRVAVVEAGGEVTGFIVLYRRRDHIHVENVAVFPACQGRGLGRALLAHWLAEVDAAGATAWLETDREANLGFYAPAGFRVRGEARVLGVRVWLLRRPLKGGAREDDPPGQHG